MRLKPPVNLAEKKNLTVRRLRAALAGQLISGFLWPGSGGAASSALKLTATPSPFQPSGTPSLTPTQTQTATPGAPFEAGGGSALSGTILLSLSEKGYAQLFWYRPGGE